ncbi:MAG: dienelactone hydrolase [Rhizobiaceae bacterium]
MENRIDAMRPDAPELALPGPYAVGVCTREFINPGQIDVVRAESGLEPPRIDRKLPVEVWYPSTTKATGGTYQGVFLRDGVKRVTLHGRAVRDGEPLCVPTGHPLVILSHGHPGNRFLMSHLGENLASKGYVCVSIDHCDSTYDDPAYRAGAAFGSTLVNRPLDQRFIMDAMAGLGDDPASRFHGLADVSRSVVIGYSMGGYGALVLAGAGVSTEAVRSASEMEGGAPDGLLAMHLAGSESHGALLDPRVRAIIPIAPWGMQRGIWEESALENIRIPMMLIAGEVDETSGYEDGVRAVMRAASGSVERRLVTFRSAGHSVAAPIPAPAESHEPVEWLDFVPFEHYADAVWDTVRMNNLAQHFITAFLDLHLKGIETRKATLAAGEPFPGIVIEA